MFIFAGDFTFRCIKTDPNARPRINCVLDDDLEGDISLLKIIKPELNKRAVAFACSDDDAFEKSYMSEPDIINYRHEVNRQDIKTAVQQDLQNLEVLIFKNPKWGITVKQTDEKNDTSEHNILKNMGLQPSPMDQSTQVNFPTLSKYPRKRLQRHNTSADVRVSSPRSLYSSPSWINNTSLPSVIPQLKLTTRPRSLNLSTETFQRSRLCYNPNDSPASRLYPTAGELTLSVISRERTPPHSSNSSVVMSGYNQKHNNNCYTQQVPSSKLSSHGNSNSHQHFLQVPLPPYQTSEGTNSTGSCKCFYELDPTDKTRMPSATPEGLSWRRLHMSRAKLKATSTTSELLSGFAMVAMVELQINEDTSVPEWLFVMFSVCTTVLVAVHIFALMISTYILPNIDAISKMDVCELVTESPHERMKGFIELAWAFSTVLGLFLFLVEVAILCWVKFWDYSFTAAIAATVIVIPVLVIFVLFAVHFYHSLVVHRCDTSISDMQKLEDMKKHLDEVTSPV